MKLPKAYEPGQYEQDIYALWESGGVFTPKNRHGTSGYYSLVVPPPNANAKMHIGTGMTLGLEDIAARYHRLKGEATLFVPGADHAGFETQAVYEKQLAKAGKSRFDFNREELRQQIWDFVAENRATFEKQFRAVGASTDWSRFTFTLDEHVVKTAYETFKKLWDDKLIYRGERLVNYCTFHRTGFADVEVEYEDATTPLYYMKYGPFTLATTRPETKFGDTAVAVNPGDDRYKEWVGKTITVEGVNGPFEVMVIADEMVDMAFGTGVVKITPAHDFNDWEVAQRHHLPAIRVINHDGTMNELTGRFRGMPVLKARKAVAEALKEMDLLVKVDEKYRNRVGKCYKCGTIIEPMLMEQWFVDMQPLAKKAIAALEKGDITFYPDAKRTQLITYLKGLRDWNISRQIAWGIPIPAFQNVDDKDDWIYDERVDQEIIEIDGKTYHRDPDVFDTWFSSSSWPYVTLKYPENDDYKNFFPLSLMETGGEILYPWVSRMIMLSLYVTGEVPFKAVYIHGYVMAEDGSKMSKSLGNTIDLQEIMEQYGSDAVRIGLVWGRTAAVNRGFDRRRVEEGRNFANKLWNIARYTEEKIGDDHAQRMTPKPETAADHWILYKLQQSTEIISQYLDKYQFSEALEAVYHTVWDDLADWYIEASKSTLNKGVLGYALETVLKLVHPFAPFVTETIWQTLAWETGFVATSEWPKGTHFDKDQAKEFEAVKAIVTEIRQLTTNLMLSKPKLYHAGSQLLEKHQDSLIALARLGAIQEVSSGKGLHLTSTTENAWLDVDFEAVRHYTQTLKSRRESAENSIKQLEGRLANKSYTDKAPKELVAETKQQLEDQKRLTAQIDQELETIANVQ